MQPDNAAILAHRAAQVMQRAPQEPGYSAIWLPWLSVALALVIAGFDLSRRRLPKALVSSVNWGVTPILDAMQALPSGGGG